MILRFGKYRGWRVDDLPESYLQWLYFQDFLKPNLEQAVKDEVAARWPDKFEIKLIYHDFGDGFTSGNQVAIKSIFRELALKYHPDCGGDTQAMQALNEFRERLLVVLD